MFSVGNSARDDMPLAFLATLTVPLTTFDAVTFQIELMPNAETVNIAFKPNKVRNCSILDVYIDLEQQKMYLGYMVENKIKVNDFEIKYLAAYTRGREGAVSIDRSGKFNILIVLIDNSFSISVNEEKVFSCEVERMKDMSVVEVRGDVDCVTEFDIRRIFPSPFPATQYRAAHNVFSLESNANYFPGKMVIIDGVADGPPDGMFVVYFPSNYRLRTLLWFGVDFATRTVGRKTMNENMEYVDEDYDGPFPFKLGEPFRMAFGFTANKFVFGVNGQTIPSYNYPLQVEKGEYNDPMFNCLLGLKVYTKNGLKFKVKAVFNEVGDEECLYCKEFSKPTHRMIV